MAKHHLTDMQDLGRHHYAKSARINRLSSPSSRIAALSAKDDKQTKASQRDAEIIARYNEVNALLSNQFPSVDINSTSHSSQASPSPTSGLIGSSSYLAFGVTGNDGYDAEHELAFEINASMGLVLDPPTPHPQRDAFLVAPTYPWATSSCIPADATTTSIPMTHDVYTGAAEEDNSVTSSPTQNYPFTFVTPGELLSITWPSNIALYMQPPPKNSRIDDAAEDVRRLGDSLQQHARMQLRELREDGKNMPYIS